MPIYEYRCRSCGHELEKLQRMNDAALTDCPSCGEAALGRLVSAAGFRLKGGGWYETDFKKGNRRNVVESGDGEAKAEKPGTDKAAKEPAKESAKKPESAPAGTGGENAAAP